jgi:hypothetical protein
MLEGQVQVTSTFSLLLINAAQPAYRRLPEEKRERLVAAARELFTETGLENTSTMAVILHCRSGIRAAIEGYAPSGKPD